MTNLNQKNWDLNTWIIVLFALMVIGISSLVISVAYLGLDVSQGTLFALIFTLFASMINTVVFMEQLDRNTKAMEKEERGRQARLFFDAAKRIDDAERTLIEELRLRNEHADSTRREKVMFQIIQAEEDYCLLVNHGYLTEPEFCNYLRNAVNYWYGKLEQNERLKPYLTDPNVFVELKKAYAKFAKK